MATTLSDSAATTFEPRVGLEEALDQAKREAKETGKKRYIHYPFCGSLVVLDRPTNGTVAVISPSGKVEIWR